MAVSAATVLNAYEFQRLSHRTVTVSADEYDVWTCKVDVEFITTDYAQANDATISPATAIQNARRNGQTVTVIGCCGVKPGVLNLAATPTTDTIVGVGVPSTIAASVITLPLTGEDMTTELTNATVLSTCSFKEPITVQCTFIEKVTGE